MDADISADCGVAVDMDVDRSVLVHDGLADTLNKPWRARADEPQVDDLKTFFHDYFLSGFLEMGRQPRFDLLARFMSKPIILFILNLSNGSFPKTLSFIIIYSEYRAICKYMEYQTDNLRWHLLLSDMTKCRCRIW